MMRETIGSGSKLMVADKRSASPPPINADSQRYLEYQRGLLLLHENTGIPPSVKILNGEVVRIGDLAVAGGTYSDIWHGEWLGKKKVRLTASSALPSVSLNISCRWP